MMCSNCGKECYESRVFIDKDGYRFESCNNCRNADTPIAKPDYRDQTEYIVGESHIGKTRDMMIEKHRKDRAATEREIGWDGKTTREQRMRASSEKKIHKRFI